MLSLTATAPGEAMRYPALKIIVVVSYVAAALVAVAAFAWVRGTQQSTALAAAAAVLAFAAVVAQAEVLRVLMDIERHARRLSAGGVGAPGVAPLEVDESAERKWTRTEVAIMSAACLLAAGLLAALMV